MQDGHINPAVIDPALRQDNLFRILLAKKNVFLKEFYKLVVN
jgi:hypothetical protein